VSRSHCWAGRVEARVPDHEVLKWLELDGRRDDCEPEPEQWQNDIDEAFERVMKANGRMDQA
jgi:hypothetical protein